MWSRLTFQLIDAARDEDLGPGDVTAALLPDGGQPVVARLVPRQAGVICGLALAPAICDAFSKRLWQTLEFAATPVGARTVRDGDLVEPGATVGTLRGPLAAVLTAERTLLNFVGRMSGVATLTRQYVDAARQTNPAVEILDTRKTVPGWRELDKYAVVSGGGHNHRTGLYDAVLIKDNHLAGIPLDQLASRLAAMVAQVRTTGGAPPTFIEVEVDNLAQLTAVCKVPGVDLVLLDNFTLEGLRAAVAHRDAQGRRPGGGSPAGRSVRLEASGGVTLATVAGVAATGIDRISIGALTHSAACLDVGLDL